MYLHCARKIQLICNDEKLSATQEKYERNVNESYKSHKLYTNYVKYLRILSS